MDAFDQTRTEPEDVHQASASPVFETPREQPDTLPTMADLDRLASDLDRVDLTLAEQDGPIRAEAGAPAGSPVN